MFLNIVLIMNLMKFKLFYSKSRISFLRQKLCFFFEDFTISINKCIVF